MITTLMIMYQLPGPGIQLSVFCLFSNLLLFPKQAPVLFNVSPPRIVFLLLSVLKIIIHKGRSNVQPLNITRSLFELVKMVPPLYFYVESIFIFYSQLLLLYFPGPGQCRFKGLGLGSFTPIEYLILLEIVSYLGSQIPGPGPSLGLRTSQFLHFSITNDITYRLGAKLIISLVIFNSSGLYLSGDGKLYFSFVTNILLRSEVQNDWLFTTFVLGISQYLQESLILSGWKRFSLVNVYFCLAVDRFSWFPWMV